MISNLWIQIKGTETLIGPDNIWALLAVMFLSVYIAVCLEEKYSWASKISAGILAMFLAMLLSNLGIIPGSVPLYEDVIQGIIMPLAIPLLLLNCNLKVIWRETGQLLILFFIGAVGSTLGALIAYGILNGSFGEAADLAGAASVLTGSYIGGSVNFAALANQFSISEELTAAATVADNVLMAFYFLVLVAIGRSGWFRKRFKHPLIEAQEQNKTMDNGNKGKMSFAGKDIVMKDIAGSMAYAIVVALASRIAAGCFSSMPLEGIAGNIVGRFLGSQYIWLTTFSVFFATCFSKQAEKLKGSTEIGSYMICLFLFTIGVPANIYMVLTKSPLLLVLAAIMVLCNMIFCFTGAKLLGMNLEEAIIASNANIGGPTTAVGMSMSQGWQLLVGPAMLVGTLGYAIGNYMGTLVGILLGL